MTPVPSLARAPVAPKDTVTKSLGVAVHRAPAAKFRLAAVGALCHVMAVSLAIVVTALPAGAQVTPRAGPGDTLTVSITDVQRLALAQNPSFLATRQETAIAEGALRQARVYQFNPELALQSVGGGIGGAARPFELVLTEEIEWAGQRGLRIGAARMGSTRASAVVQNAGRLTLAAASAGFYRALAAERRLSVARDALVLTDRLIAAVRTQLAEGEVSTMEANLAEIEVGRARARVLTARREEASASLELKELLGLSPEAPIRLAAAGGGIPGAIGDEPPAAPVLAEDSLVVLALARRPDLAARAAAVRESETLTTLARRSSFPNLRLGAAMERGEQDGSPRLGPAIGLSLPLFNRNQGLVDQRLALTAQARLDQRATALRIRAEVVEAVRAYRSASEESALYETSVVRPARDNIALLEIAYREGKISLPTLLLLRNQLLDAEFGYWDAWLVQQEALVRLDAATGALTPSAEALPPLDADSARGPVPTDTSSRTAP